METHWRRPKFLRRPKRTLKRTGHIALNLFFALALVVLSYAPLMSNLPGVGKSIAPQTAEAKNLEWGDVRPPLTDEKDTDEAGGFDALPRFGNVPHPLVVSTNGDIFTAGNPGDIDFNGNGDCTSAAAGVNPADIDFAPIGACDKKAPVLYKSSDGLKWRSAVIGTDAGQGGAMIRDIAVSPKYPNDPFVIVVFSDGVDTAAGALATTNGFAFSVDGGNTFTVPVINTAATLATSVAKTVLRTVTLSSDFTNIDSNGKIAIGGNLRGAAAAPASSAYRAEAKAFNGGTPAAPTGAAALATWTPMTTAAAFEVTGTQTLSLKYSANEEPLSLGRVVVNDAGTATFGQVTSSADWAAFTAAGAGGANEIRTAASGAYVAVRGEFGFDDKYETNGTVYAAVSNGATPSVGGVYKFSGSWVSQTTGTTKCDQGYSSLSVTGDVSTAAVLSSSDSNNVRVCRSTNAGSTWSSVDADGGDSVTSDANMGSGITRIARNRATPARVFWSTSGALGGVAWSANGGSGFQDGGLTNDAYVVTTVTEASDMIAFAGATAGARKAMFKTTNYGEGAAWYRVDRTPDGEGAVVLAPDFATSGVAYIRRGTTKGADRMLLSTNAGERFKHTSSSATEDEILKTASARSSTVVYVSTEKGKIFRSEDRGSSWTQLPFNVTSRRVNSMVFSTNADFFVTALSDDSTLKVYHTTDSGATWSMVGNAPWGTITDDGAGGMTLVLGTYSATSKTGAMALITNKTTSTKDIFRINVGTETSWTKLDTAKTWSSFLSTPAANQGDGRLVTLWQNTAAGGPLLRQSYNLFSAATDRLADVNDVKDRMLNLPLPPLTAGTMGTARTLPGYTLQTTTGGRIMELTLNPAFLAPMKTTNPAPNATVITNTTDNGVPVIFRWDAVDRADAYDVIIGLAPDLADGIFVNAGAITTNVTEVDKTAGGKSLVPGQTYYWAVRVSSTIGIAGAGGAGAVAGPQSNWSPISKFSVVPASGTVSRSPEPQLPTNNTTTANMGPILVSWNNPPGTTQYHIEVRPAGDDGPGIGLIISDAAMVASASYTIQPPKFGAGNYVMLPGATYNWRVRTSGSTTSIGVTDSSWGPWSAVFTFKTPRANAGTIQLVKPINGQVVTDRTPTLEWKDSNSQMFYYEVQLSSDSDFGAGPRGPFTAVQHQLVHAGESNPPGSYTSPVTLKPGMHYWRVRQRTQATLLGPEEPGIAWSPTQSVMVQ